MPSNASVLEAAPRLAAAFEAIWPEAAAIPVTDLAPVNIDLRAAYRTVVASLPRIAHFQEATRALGNFDVTIFERLETYALAALHAHLVYLGAPATARRSGGRVADARQRTFTLLVRSYDQIRRALSYLRWNEGDVDRIAPSLWAGRGGSRPKQSRSAGNPGGGERGESA